MFFERDSARKCRQRWRQCFSSRWQKSKDGDYFPRVGADSVTEDHLSEESQESKDEELVDELSPTFWKI